MSDDRDFSQYQSGGRYLTFREYIRRVISDKSRSDELQILIKFFGMPVIDQVLEGKRIIEAIDFLKAMSSSNNGK